MNNVDETPASGAGDHDASGDRLTSADRSINKAVVSAAGVVMVTSVALLAWLWAETDPSSGVAVADLAGSSSNVFVYEDSTVTSVSTSTTTTVSTTTTTLPPRAEPGLVSPSSSGVLDDMVIVVDPGHNGKNFAYSGVTREDSPFLCNTTGATSPSGMPEYAINWSIGTRLADMFAAMGATVVLTHADNDGFGPCADERGLMAKEAKADALISIHADGSTSGGSGFHIIHPGEHDDLDPVVVERSGALAAAVRDELAFAGGRTANYVGTIGLKERSDLANLNSANRPAILAELGNLRNPVDSAMLEEPSSQELIAAALARGFLRYLGEPTQQIPVHGDLNADGFRDMLPDYSTTTTIPTSIGPDGTAPVATAPTTTAPLPDKSQQPTTTKPSTATTTTRPTTTTAALDATPTTV